MKYIVEFEDEPCMYEDEVYFYKCIQAPWWGLSENVIKQLTPYQPERKQGEWIGHLIEGADTLSIDEDTCSHCGTRFYQIAETGADWNFCPSCGAYMRKGEPNATN